MIYSIDYSSGYSEGDNNPSSVVNCDLTDINNKLVELISVLDRIENKISSLPTADGIKVYFDNNIPFVDDMSLKAFKAGDLVDVVGLDNIPCIVESSHMLPVDLTNFIIVYTVSYIVDSVKYTSNFPSGHISFHKVL
ncbi:hypothetical protein [Sulfurimonas sp.]|uniref:hypothetical protein n=1 Tax=Sulfurimonas sp. TaxID=2022749 RepID=UPI002605CC71|nr:hypothetical protein [Sulfurimonas sp.]MDD5156870.1 hypothetical protein [Sulfurimonas sp.]